ncbi:TIR domain-containing adapter molecule 1, partial [Merops nubicus]
MAQAAKLQPSFEDVFSILAQIPQDKLLSLKYKLKHLTFGPSSKLLQAMVLLTLGQEVDARICLDALGDNRAAQYVHQAKLGAVGAQDSREDLQPPQLDAGAKVLLAEIYSVLAEEKLCSHEAKDKACQAANKGFSTSKETRGDTLNCIPPEEQEKHSSALSTGPADRFLTLRSDVDGGFLETANPNSVVRSSPVQIGGSSDLSGPGPLCSVGSTSFSSQLEISASPTVAFQSPPASHQRVHQPCPGTPSTAGQPNGEGWSHSPQETSWASSSYPGQDAGAQVPRPEEVLQVSSSDPTLPTPAQQLPTMGAVNQPVTSSDVSSTAAAEPQVSTENTQKKPNGKQSSTDLPDSRATVDTGPAHVSMEDSCVPAAIPSNAASASILNPSLPPPPPPYSFSSALPPPLRGAPSQTPYPPPFPSSPTPGCPPPLRTVEPVPTSQPDSAERKFFTFVVLHASKDEIVAHRVKNLLENLGVPNGATLCEDFSIAGHSHLTCFQDAMENSAFIILLLTKNFLCNLCMFQTDTALMESILNPSKHHSVIPFVPKENPLERSQIPSTLGGLIPLDENSPLFPRTVQNTFSASRINAKKVLWDQAQRRKLQRHQEQNQTLEDLAALNLGSHPQ